jgi:hypothetical protein
VRAGDWAATGTDTGAGTSADGTSSSWDAPQFRQNFAFGATGFPHSGQNGILITTEWLNVVHKEHSILIRQNLKGNSGKNQRRAVAMAGAYFFTIPRTSEKF